MTHWSSTTWGKQVSWGKFTYADTCPSADTYYLTVLQHCNIVLFRPLLARTMVRKYERKTTRKPISQNVLDQAKSDVENGKSIRATATKFGMDESTLRKRLRKVITADTLFVGLHNT